jgi:hypothetical protein
MASVQADAETLLAAHAVQHGGNLLERGAPSRFPGPRCARAGSSPCLSAARSAPVPAP